MRTTKIVPSSMHHDPFVAGSTGTVPCGDGAGTVSYWRWLVFVMLVAFVSMIFGGLLTAEVSLPVLYVLPTVRRQFVAVTEKIWDDQVDSVVDRRFIGAYVLAIHIYGFTTFSTAVRLARALPDRTAPVLEPVDPVPVVAAVGIIAGGVPLGVSRTMTRSRLRACGEWGAFLGPISVLVVVAFVVVPMIVGWLFNLALQ